MSVARSYARALLEAATERKTGAQELDQIETSLRDFVGLMDQSKPLWAALVGPASSVKEKTAVVTELARKGGYPTLLTNFLVLLARKERLGLAREVSESLAQARLEAEGGILGAIVSADPLDPADVAGLSNAFSKKLGKKVAFRSSTDPELLAGMKVVVSGVTYDGTLRSQLRRLRDRLVYGTKESAH